MTFDDRSMTFDKKVLGGENVAHYYRKRRDAQSKDGREILFFFFRVFTLFALTFSVALCFARIFSFGPRVRYLALICLACALICVLMWDSFLPAAVTAMILFVFFFSLIVVADDRLIMAFVGMAKGDIQPDYACRLIIQYFAKDPLLIYYGGMALLLVIGGGMFARRGNAIAFHLAALVGVCVSFVTGEVFPAYWTVLYVGAALLYRTTGSKVYDEALKEKVRLFRPKKKRLSYYSDQYRVSDRGFSSAARYLVPLCILSWLFVLVFPELNIAVNRIAVSPAHAVLNNILEPFFLRVRSAVESLGYHFLPPAPDLLFGEGTSAFSEVVSHYSGSGLLAYFHDNSLRLIFLIFTAGIAVFVAAMKVRRENAELKASGRRMRQTNRRRALQEIGEAAGRLATWYTGEDLSPWDEEFVVKTATVLPKISGVDLQMMRDMMNRVRYGKSEILETDYRRMLELYLKMFDAGKKMPSEAVRRKLCLPM